MSPTHIGFDVVGSSGAELPEKVKGSDPIGDKEMKIYLDDEPRSLLNSLNAWQEKVVVEELPEILSFLTP